MITKGAFAEFPKRMAKDGTTISLLYNHNQSLDSFIDRVTDNREDDHGILFTATFDDTQKTQRTREFAELSFMYGVLDRGEVELELYSKTG